MVGGSFNNVGGNYSPGLSEWSASAWSPLNPGTDYPVHAIYKDASDGKIYIGGEFLTVGGISATRIAVYDGVNWSALGNGLPASVNSILRYNATLYAGTLSGLYRWTGTTWQELNFNDMSYVIISDMEIYQNELYVAGSFDTAEGNIVNGIARFNGSYWSGIGTGLDQDGIVDVLEIHENELVIGGLFESINGVTCGGLATWNGTSAAALGTGVPVSVPIGWPGRVSALESIGNSLYVGGYFGTIDGVAVNNVAKYDGVNFSAMGDGLDNTVIDMLEFEGDLIIGGSFVNSGSSTVNHIAKWEGVSGLDNVQESKLEPFPNPVSDKLMFTSNTEIKELHIFDAQGREIARRENLGTGVQEIVTSEWKPGVYVLRAYTDTGQFTERVVKE